MSPLSSESKNITQVRNQFEEAGKQVLHAVFLFGLFFDPEDRRDMFL
jgi:hypothetical protein